MEEELGHLGKPMKCVFRTYSKETEYNGMKSKSKSPPNRE